MNVLKSLGDRAIIFSKSASLSIQIKTENAQDFWSPLPLLKSYNKEMKKYTKIEYRYKHMSTPKEYSYLCGESHPKMGINQMSWKGVN